MDSERSQMLNPAETLPEETSPVANTPSAADTPPDKTSIHENSIMMWALLGGLPSTVVALVLLWVNGYTAKVLWSLTAVCVFCWLRCAIEIRGRVVLPLQTLSSLLGALREGDFSIRGRGATRRDALGDVLFEINELGDLLRTQRLGAQEATLLLRAVMTEFNVAVFAFDKDERLVLVNRAGERLIGRPARRSLGRSAAQLKLDECLRSPESVRTLQMTFPAGAGRWEIRRSSFRNRGVTHQLLVISDLSRALREEERQAWQRLVRVLGHEVNNSLAPIKSIGESLEELLNCEPYPADWREDMQSGLSVITARAAALSRFMSAYARLARLPPPTYAQLDVAALIRRAVETETRIEVKLLSGPEFTIEADHDQLEQLLINLIRNAVDAALETGGGVSVGWAGTPSHLEIWIEDEGSGLTNTDNLFVPFFTTKKEGSGIGLVLSREIAEGHGGTLTLENRATGRGCKARLQLPLSKPPNGKARSEASATPDNTPNL